MTEALQLEIRTLRALLDSERDPAGRAFAPLADAYRRAGQIPEALRLLRDGIAKHPDFVTGHVVAAQLYVEQGLTAEGVIAARRALELDGENVHALKSLLRALEETGEAEQASSVRSTLTTLEPDFTPDWGKTGRAPSGESPAEEQDDAALAPTLELPAVAPELPDDRPGEVAVDVAFDLQVEDEAATASDDAPVGAQMIDLTTLGPLPLADVSPSALAPDLPESPPEAPLDLQLVGLDLPGGLDVASDEDRGDATETAEPAIDEPVLHLATDEADEPAMDLAALAPDSTDEAPVMDLPLLSSDDEEGEAVLELASLAPDAADDEPVMDLAALAPEADDEPVMDLAALAPEPDDEPVMDLAALAPDLDEGPVMDLAALAPDADDEPVMDLATLAPDEDDEPVMDLPLLAPDGGSDDGAAVLDVAALAPDADDEPVMDLAALAPDDEPVMDLATLAPDADAEPVMDLPLLSSDDEADEAALDVAALAPDAPDDEPVMDLVSLAPDAPDDEPVMELATLAPDDEPDEPMDLPLLALDDAEEDSVLDVAALAPAAGVEEQVFTLDALAPEGEGDYTPTHASGTTAIDAGSDNGQMSVDEAVEVGFAAPEDTDEIVVDLEVLRAEHTAISSGPPPSGRLEVELEAEAELPGADDAAAEPSIAAQPAEHDAGGDAEASTDDHGEPIFTRTLAELYAAQGAVKEAITVLKHLREENPRDEGLSRRIAELEAGRSRGARAEEPERAREEPEEDHEVETLARDLAESGARAEDVASPFAWTDREPAEDDEAGGATIREYFDALLDWEPRDS